MQQSHGLLATAKLLVYTENKKIVAFEAPFGGLGATYAVNLRLIGKLMGDFLLVIIELFSLGAFVLSQCTTDGRTDRWTDRQMLITIPRLHSCSAVKTLSLIHI